MVNSNKNIILVTVAILAVIVTGVLIFLSSHPANIVSFFKLNNNIKPKETIAKETIAYINSNLLQPGQTATLNSVSEESGLIKINIKVGDGDYNSYVTKDGKFLFPQDPINLSSASSNVNKNANSPATFTITKANHVKGNFDAPVTLVEFSDFQCPFCHNLIPTLDRITSEYKDSVRLVYKHFPLSKIHPNAEKAAEASECASEQGKFWEYHDILFANQQSLSVENYKKWAAELKLNANQFDTCLSSLKYEKKVQADYAEGAALGVTGTPTTFVNGKLISGAVPYEDFKKEIDALLQHK